MRWRKRNSTPAKDGDRRTRAAFLWKPLTIQGETRWLEFARWREVYCHNPGWSSKPHVYDEWIPEMWLAINHPRSASVSPDPPWSPPSGNLQNQYR